jgi:WD40 repeat protein
MNRRRKNADFSRRVVTDIAKVVRQSKLSNIAKVIIHKRYQMPCRVISYHSSWISSVSVCVTYTPILLRTQYDDDLRYRMVAVSGSSGPSLCVFDLELGTKLFDIHGHNSVVYSVTISSPLEQSETMPVIVSGSHDGLMKVWDLQSGTCVHEVGRHRHEGPVRAAFVYEGVNPMMYSAAGSTLWVWLLETAELICTVEQQDTAIMCLTVFRSTEAFADETRPAVIVTGAQDGKIAVCHMETYELMHKLEGHNGPVYSLQVARTARPVLVSGGFDHTARVWDIIEGDLLYVIDDNHCPVFSVNILNTPKFAILVGTAAGRVRAYHIADGSFAFELSGHTGPVKGICSTLTPRPFVVTGSHDNSVRIWDLATLGKDTVPGDVAHTVKKVLMWKDPGANALSDSEEEEEEEEGEEQEGSTDEA